MGGPVAALVEAPLLFGDAVVAIDQSVEFVDECLARQRPVALQRTRLVALDDQSGRRVAQHHRVRRPRHRLT